MKHFDDDAVTGDQLAYLRTSPANAPEHAEDHAMHQFRHRHKRSASRWQGAIAACVIFAVGIAVGRSFDGAHAETVATAGNAYLQTITRSSTVNAEQVSVMAEVFRKTADKLLITSAPQDMQTAARFTLRSAQSSNDAARQGSVIWF